MDVVIVAGDSPSLIEAALPEEYLIVWDYKKYKMTSEFGLDYFKKKYKAVGVIIEPEETIEYSSYGIILDIEDAYYQRVILDKEVAYYQNETCKFFAFLENLKEFVNKGEQFCIAFSNVWEKGSLIRHKKYTIRELKNRLYTHNSWKQSYLNLETKEYEFDDCYPLVVELLKEEGGKLLGF